MGDCLADPLYCEPQSRKPPTLTLCSRLSYTLNLKGRLCSGLFRGVLFAGVMKGETRSLEYSSFSLGMREGLEGYAPWCGRPQNDEFTGIFVLGRLARNRYSAKVPVTGVVLQACYHQLPVKRKNRQLPDPHCIF